MTRNVPLTPQFFNDLSDQQSLTVKDRKERIHKKRMLVVNDYARSPSEVLKKDPPKCAKLHKNRGFRVIPCYFVVAPTPSNQKH